MSRAERRFRTQKVVAKRVRQMIDLNYPTRPYSDRRIGLCKAKSPFDCGKTNCFICSHSGPSRQKLIADIDYKEQLREIDFPDGLAV